MPKKTEKKILVKNSKTEDSELALSPSVVELINKISKTELRISRSQEKAILTAFTCKMLQDSVEEAYLELDK